MTCKYEYNSSVGTIDATTDGIADLEELVAMVRHIAELCGEKRSANIIVDHSQLNAGTITMDEVRTLSNVTVSLKDFIGKRKCAHVVANDLQYGLVRAWEMMVELSGYREFEMRVFRTRNEALDWVQAGTRVSIQRPT